MCLLFDLSSIKETFKNLHAINQNPKKIKKLNGRDFKELKGSECYVRIYVFNAFKKYILSVSLTILTNTLFLDDYKIFLS